MTESTTRRPLWRRPPVAAALAIAMMLLVGLTPIASPAPANAQAPPIEPEYHRAHPTHNGQVLPLNSIAVWRSSVPGIADVRIRSSIDGHMQPALWLAPNEPGPRPLLVALHSWSVSYNQTASIPYAHWARDNGWAMIHPDFRGVSNNADATGSDLAVQDVADAIAWAKAHADIDENNIYVIGFSGGGMMSLLTAGRHPDLIAGAVSWVPIYDLVEWYRYSANQRYVSQIAASCGGNPLTNAAAREQCAWRSPRAHLDRARDGGVPVYIGHGLNDRLVLPEQAVWAFNHLAQPGDRLTAAESAAIASNRLPPHLDGQIQEPTWFRPGDPAPRFARQSGNVTLVLFNGGHIAAFNPGLEWMVRQTAASEPSPRVSGAIARLYYAGFARDPDHGGQTYWTRLYLSGRSLPAIAMQFVTSPEFRNRYGHLDDRAFVAQLYRNVFDREPDAGGLAFWTNQLAAGRTRGYVLTGFSQSGEMRAVTGTP